MRVDHDLAAIGLHSHRLEAQAFGERTAANCDEHNVGVDRLRLTAGCRLDRRLDARPRLSTFVTL